MDVTRLAYPEATRALIASVSEGFCPRCSLPEFGGRAPGVQLAEIPHRHDRLASPCIHATCPCCLWSYALDDWDDDPNDFTLNVNAETALFNDGTVDLPRWAIHLCEHAADN